MNKALSVNDVPRCHGPRRICRAVSTGGIRQWVREEAGFLGIAADWEFVDRCVNAGALGASHLVHGRYLRERQALRQRVQEAVQDSEGPPAGYQSSLARIAPGALHRLECGRVQEAVEDNDPQTGYKSSLARIAPGALRRLKARGA